MPQAIYGSLERLNAMHTLFTKSGNGALDAGEVDALAAFHGGLPASSQAKIHARLVDIYKESKFSSGQRQRFLGLLKDQGFTLKELEGQGGDTADGFLKLSKGAQLGRLQELGQEGAEGGKTKSITLGHVAQTAAAKIKTELKSIDKALHKKHGASAEVSLDALEITAISKLSGRKAELLGYRVRVPVYAQDHDVSESYYFNLRGVRLGSEYSGE